MTDIKQIVATLKGAVTNIENQESSKIDLINNKIQSLLNTAAEFESLWAGGWARNDYNTYINPINHQDYLQVNNKYFFELLHRQNNIDYDQLSNTVNSSLKTYRKLKTEVATELSIIRGNEIFKNEEEILKSIESYKWGIEASDYIKMQTPRQMPIYDLDVLNRGIQVPPHIAVMADLVSLATKTVSLKTFSEIVTRILRQIEIKLNVGSISLESNQSEIILSHLIDNFHDFYTQLKNRYDGRPSFEIKDEYDVQDLFHAILKLHFSDIRKEDNVPSYAGRSTRVDFLLPNEKIVIEIKKTRDKLTDREIGDQLILDAAHYKNHPNCRILKCFIYDPENKVRNPRGLESDLNRLSDSQMTVEVFIRP